MFARLELTPDPLTVPIFVERRTPLQITEPPQRVELRQKRFRQQLLVAAGIRRRSSGGHDDSQEILTAYDAVRRLREVPTVSA